jgi:hypothetical protein
VTNNREPAQPLPVSTSHFRPALEPRREAQVGLWKPGLVSCALLCIFVLTATTACGASHSPSSTSKNRVVFNQTVSTNLVTPAFILTGSQQMLAWSCSPGGTATLIIDMGAAGSNPSPIFKGMCALSSTSGTDTLHMLPGSYFFRFLPGGTWHITLTDIDYSMSEATAIAHKPLPPGTPTPPPFSPSMNYQTAWGPHAVTATYRMTIDATHTFVPSTVAPDGRTLLGGEWLGSGAGSVFQAGYFDLATRHFTAIGVSDSVDEIQCCMSDGRFLIAKETIAPQTAGPTVIRYWAYDLQTGRLRQLFKTGDPQNVIAVSHGLLITSSTVVNLATGTTTRLSTSFANVLAFSWPYLVYTATPTTPQSSPYRLRNLATGAERTMPSLKNSQIPYIFVGDTLIGAVVSFATSPNEFGLDLYGVSGTVSFYALDHVLSGGTQVTQLGSFTGDVAYTVTGDTLYVSVLTGQTTNSLGLLDNIGWTTLYAIDQITSGGTPPRMVASFNGDVLDLVAANGRVIACTGLMVDPTTQDQSSFAAFWDLASHTFVTFPPFTGGNTPLINVAGNDLLVAQSAGSGETVLDFDTSKLPTAPANA